MKVLCDTSYLLPLIKLSIEELPDDLLWELLKESKHEYFYSELSIFEITAKGFKFILKETNITLQDIISGLDALKNNSQLKTLSWSDNPLIIELASKFKAFHKDTIDCIVFSTAICTCDCIITMDHTFYDIISKDNKLLSEILDLNDHFYFWFDDLKSEPILLKK
jgi:PIN domain nuclease of toxin-antitoxin system